MGHNAALHGKPCGRSVTLMNINEIERVLAAEPRNVRALILKADHLGNAGDSRSPLLRPLTLLMRRLHPVSNE